MDYCEECQSVEQGFEYITDEDGNEDIPVCTQCGSENSRGFVDEDRYKDF